MPQPDTQTEDEDNTGQLPAYKKRAEIISIADGLTRHEEPAASGELCGLTPESVEARLDKLKAAIENARDELEVPGNE